MRQLLQLLQLMQLTDSAIPVGAAAHSFGMESLAEWRLVEPDSLAQLIGACVANQGLLEACYLRATYVAQRDKAGAVALCQRLSATKTSRESREASIALGNRLLHLCQSILAPDLVRALVSSLDARHTHQVLVFGSICELLDLEQDFAVAAFLQQSVAAMVSVAQRLMPLGQRQAAAVQWTMKPLIIETVAKSLTTDYRTVGCFLPLLEIASMRHPRLETRLFLS